MLASRWIATVLPQTAPLHRPGRTLAASGAGQTQGGSAVSCRSGRPEDARNCRRPPPLEPAPPVAAGAAAETAGHPARASRRAAASSPLARAARPGAAGLRPLLQRPCGMAPQGASVGQGSPWGTGRGAQGRCASCSRDGALWCLVCTLLRAQTVLRWCGRDWGRLTGTQGHRWVKTWVPSRASQRCRPAGFLRLLLARPARFPPLSQPLST